MIAPTPAFPAVLDRCRAMVADPQPHHTATWRFAAWAALKANRGQPISEAAEARLPPPGQPPTPALDLAAWSALKASRGRPILKAAKARLPPPPPPRPEPVNGEPLVPARVTTLVADLAAACARTRAVVRRMIDGGAA